MNPVSIALGQLTTDTFSNYLQVCKIAEAVGRVSSALALL